MGQNKLGKVAELKSFIPEIFKELIKDKTIKGNWKKVPSLTQQFRQWATNSWKSTEYSREVML